MNGGTYHRALEAVEEVTSKSETRHCPFTKASGFGLAFSIFLTGVAFGLFF